MKNHNEQLYDQQPIHSFENNKQFELKSIHSLTRSTKPSLLSLLLIIIIILHRHRETFAPNTQRHRCDQSTEFAIVQRFQFLVLFQFQFLRVLFHRSIHFKHTFISHLDTSSSALDIRYSFSGKCLSFFIK